MPADRTLKFRPPRTVPYEQVVSLEAPPAPPPPANASSMAHLVSQTQQAPQAPHPYSHPAYQHYPPPVYPYPPQPQYHPSYHYTQQHVPVPPPYVRYPLNGHNPPAQPPAPAPAPPQPQPQPQTIPQPSPSTAENPPLPAQQEADPPSNARPHWERRALTEDEDTKLVRCALRWVFVRDPAVSLQLFWHDVTKSFERISGRHFATCKRRVGILEDQWRAKFAARSTQGGLPGNNNSDLGRAMRAWIDFRDDEERAKKEIEEDVKALDVRRRKLHELEIERLGQTDVCRYETTVVGEEEEIGPQGIETTVLPPTNSNTSHVDTPEDEGSAESRDRPSDFNLPVDLERSDSGKHPKATDQVAIIAELLRKRQRDEREEADIRREEQVLLNKRLAMMEEQMQMLSKLIKVNTQREDDPLPASPPRPIAGSTNKDAEPAAGSGTGSGAAQTRDIVVIDDVSENTATTHDSGQSPIGPAPAVVPGDPGGATSTVNGTTDHTADDTMIDSAGTPAESDATTGAVSMKEVTPAAKAVDNLTEVSTNKSIETLDGSSAELGHSPSTSVSAMQTSAIHASEVSDAESADTNMQEAHELMTGSVSDHQAMQTPTSGE